MNKKSDFWFRDWFLDAQVLDTRYPHRGASSWFPYGYRFIRAILDEARRAIEAIGYQEVILPAFVSAEALTRQAEQIKNFLDRVYVVHSPGSDGEQVIRSTIEAQASELFVRWRLQGRPLPYRVHSTRAVGRYELGHTRPLWKERVVWPFFEAHTALSTAEVNNSIKHLDDATRIFCHAIGLPIISVERIPTNDRLTEYAHRRLEAITILPSGKVMVLTSIYDLGDRFSRLFDLRDIDGKYPSMINFAFSGRLLLALLNHCVREGHPVLPPAVAPIQVAIVPVRSDDPILLDKAKGLERVLNEFGCRANAILDIRGYRYRLQGANQRGIPLVITLGHKELETQRLKITSPLYKIQPEVAREDLGSALRQILGETQLEFARQNEIKQKSHIVTADNIEEAIVKARTGKTVALRGAVSMEQLKKAEQLNIDVLGRLMTSSINMLPVGAEKYDTILLGSKTIGDK